MHLQGISRWGWDVIEGLEAGSSDDMYPSGGHSGRLWHVANAWVPVLICVLVIAIESTPYFGSDHTSSPLRRLAEYFFGPFTGSQWWNIHHAIRKAGHFTGYGILLVAWFRAFWMTYRPSIPLRRRLLASHELAMAGTFVVACSDEVHQLYLPNRTGSGWDVLLDCCGAAVVQLLVWLWMARRLQRSAGKAIAG